MKAACYQQFNSTTSAAFTLYSSLLDFGPEDFLTSLRLVAMIQAAGFGSAYFVGYSFHQYEFIAAYCPYAFVIKDLIRPIAPLSEACLGHP